jgi:hypothetical protein
MNLRVIALHFVDGIASLGSRLSLACEDIGGGVPLCQSIKRYSSGYLVGFRDKLWFVSDTQVRCAQVVDEDAEEEKQTKASIQAVRELSAKPEDAPAPPPPPAPPKGRTAAEILAAAEPGTIVELPGGVFTRVPPREAAESTPPPESTPKEPAHTMTRRGRTARMGPVAEAKE